MKTIIENRQATCLSQYFMLLILAAVMSFVLFVMTNVQQKKLIKKFKNIFIWIF